MTARSASSATGVGTTGSTALAEASLGGAIMSAIPDFLLAALFLWTWLHPTSLHPQMVKRLVSVVLLEFIIVHSAAFAGIVALSDMQRARKAAALIGLGAIYMLFAWGISAGSDSKWPTIAFFGLMLNRLLGVLLGAVPSEAQKKYLGSCWTVGAAAYVGCVFLTIVTAVPALGVTPDVIASQHFSSGGLWPEQPYRALAVGALYYTIIGAWEILGIPLVMSKSRLDT